MTKATPIRSDTGIRDDLEPLAVSQRDVRDARRLLAILSGTESPAHRDSLAQRARDRQADRQLWISLFGPDMSSEHAEEILLSLYLAEGGQRLTQTALAELCSATRSTANRWIDSLDRRGVILREQHPTDRRRFFTRLSDEGRERLELYLSATGR